MFSLIIRSTWLYLQHLVIFTNVAAGWCRGWVGVPTHPWHHIYRVPQEEYARLREGVPYVKVYPYNPKHLCPKLNGYGDNGQRKVRSSGGSTHCTLSADGLWHVFPRLPCQITEIPLTLLRQYPTMADCMSCIVLGTLKDNYDVSAGFFCSSI